jgi:hypothetical protein
MAIHKQVVILLLLDENMMYSTSPVYTTKDMRISIINYIVLLVYYIA